MNLLKIIKLSGVLVFIGFLLYVAHSFYKSKELINYTQLTLPMLIDVSEEWDISAVQKYINPIEFNRNITFYESMISKSAYLGKFDSCINLQLFVNLKEKSFMAIEINPRFGGGYPLSYAAGANFPKMIIQEYILNEDINFVDDWENNLLMLRYDSNVFVNDYKS